MGKWYIDVQKQLGIKPTPQNNKFLQNWQRWEGGHFKNDAKYNWLNTTHGTGSSINSVGVKRFRDYNEGIRYTAETLLNGRYDDIVGALQQGNPYKYNVASGLQTWVSGSPTGNPGYAAKVLGRKSSSGSVAPKASLPKGGRGPKGNPGLATDPGDGNKYFAELAREVFGGSLGESFAQAYFPEAKKKTKASQRDASKRSLIYKPGQAIMLRTKYKGTHVTDGLGWGKKTAEDIMGSPGTPVLAPVGGRVIYWHPTGAQGGGSMLLRLDNGQEMWLGHIDGGMQKGTRFKPGQELAVISPDHPRPHVHVDVRG